MIHNLFETGASMIDCLLAVWFITKFNYSSWRNIWWIPTFLLKFILQLLADHYAGNFSLLNSLIQFLIAVLYAILISKRHWVRAVISACLFSGTLIALSSALYNLYGFLFHDFDSLLMWGNSIPRYIYVVTHKVALFAVLALILRLMNRESIEGTVSGILTFAFSVVTVVGMSLTIAVIRDKPGDVAQVRLLWIALIFCMLNVFLYTMLSQLSQIQKKNYDLKMQNEIMEREGSKYEATLRIWNQSEKIRHDVKHQLLAISGMLEEEDISGCKQYLDNYLSKIDASKKFTHSGNTVVDYLVDSKLSPLKNTEIVVSGSAADLKDIEIADLASLIGNILDNAVEAEEKVKEKRIELHFIHQHDNRVIICKNSIETSVLRNNQGLHTTKNNPQHGYGCQIVAEIAKKYCGLVDYYEDANMFGVQITLPSPK